MTALAVSFQSNRIGWATVARSAGLSRLGADGVGKSRYFTVTTVRIKAGRANDYEEYTKQYNRARDKANLDEHTAVYQVITGASSGTFISFGAARSLAEWDDFTRKMQARNKAIDDALGGDLVVKQRRETAEAIFAESRSTAVTTRTSWS